MLGAAQAGAANKVVILDTHKGNLGAQVKRIISDLMPVLGQRTGKPLELVFQTDRNLFLQAARSSDVSFAHTMELELLPQLRQLGYVPLASISLFGSADDSFCLFVPKTSSVKSTQDLAGKRVSGYPTPISYFVLRKVLGKRPERFFSSFRPIKSGQDGIYALSLGQSDAAISTRTNYFFLQIANPGPLKKVKMIQCLDFPNPFPPILVRQSVPSDQRANMFQFMQSFRQDPSMKKYLSMFNMVKMTFTTPNLQQFKKVEDLATEGKKKGWDADRIQWLKMFPEMN